MISWILIYFLIIFLSIRCKKCSKEMSSLVKRMKEHLVKCQLEVEEDNTNGNIFENGQSSYNDTIGNK